MRNQVAVEDAGRNTLSVSSSNVSQTLRSHLLGIWWRSVCEEKEEIEIFFPSLIFWKVKKKKRGTLFKQLLNTFPIFSS